MNRIDTTGGSVATYRLGIDLCRLGIDVSPSSGYAGSVEGDSSALRRQEVVLPVGPYPKRACIEVPQKGQLSKHVVEGIVRTQDAVTQDAVTQGVQVADDNNLLNTE